VSPAEGGHGPDLTEAQGRPPAVPKRVTVAVLPLGTSNDFAATTGIPEVGQGSWASYLRPVLPSWPGLGL
jgi:hypothetical protein